MQRYVLILEVPDDIDVPFSRSFSETDYYRECARRKKLALLAFSEGIKRYLSTLRRALLSCRLDANLKEKRFSMPSLDRVIPTVVIGNEMDHFWVTDDGKARASAMEMGWFHVLLSAPLRAESQPWIRNVGLGLAELSSYVNKDEKGPKLAWLENVLHTGLPVALEELQWMVRGSVAFQRASSVFPGADPLGDLVFWDEIKAWELSCKAVGYSWITAGTNDADEFLGIASWTELVQLVGLHWYHHWSNNSIKRGVSWHVESHPERLLNENDLIEDVEDFLAVTYHHVPTWWLSEIGFPAEKPWIPDQWRVPDAVWNPEASPRLQAIVVARRMLLLRCLEKPPAMLVWWNSMSGVVGEVEPENAWGQFTAMGLRNDCAREYDVENRRGTFKLFRHDYHAWARPGWYAFRRVAWLLSQATSGEIVFSDASRNAMVLRLTGSFRLPGGASRRSYDSLLVAWMDPPSVRVVARRISLWFRSEGEVVRVSLVPDVAPVIQNPSSPDLDGNQYPTLAVPDWTWPGWDGGILSQYHFGYWQWADTVVSTQPHAPFCILANGLEVVSVEST